MSRFSSYLLLIIFLNLTSFVSQAQTQQISTANENSSFLEIATAILQNKKTLQDNTNYYSTYASWQGSGWQNSHSTKFTMKEGLISQYWFNNYNYDSPTLWTFDLQIFDGNYLDQNYITVQIQVSSSQVKINQPNATLLVPPLPITIVDYPYACLGDFSVYILDKTTKQPPQTFDVSNLQAYTKQFRLISAQCDFEFTTTLFENSYYISQEDKYYLVIGSIVYLIVSLSSMYKNKPNKRKVAEGTVRFMLFFNFYIISYLLVWFSSVNIVPDVLYYFIPLAVVVLIDFFKHLIEICKNDTSCCCCVFFGPLLSFIVVIIPEIGAYVGDFITCIYLLPQVLLKYQERHERHKHLTLYEIGNWICITLWVVYLDLYPNNAFLSSPKPALVFIHITTILVQFSILVYLQYAVERKKIFKYTFAVKDTKDQENLLEEQCAICMGEFEINAEDDKLYKTPCGHLFHSSCLKEWGDKKLQCPCCRTDLPTFVYPIE